MRWLLRKNGGAYPIDHLTTIREAVQSDLQTVVELWKEYMDFHADRDPLLRRSATCHQLIVEEFHERVSDDKSLLLVAETNGVLVGTCLARIAKRPPVFEKLEYGFISDLAVTQSHRRSGIGERLLQQAKEWLAANGIDRIELRVVVSNEVASAFWRKMGFKPYMETLCLEM